MPGICFYSENKGHLQDRWSWVFSNYGITEIWELDADHGAERGKDGAIYQETVKIATAAELPAERTLVVLQPIDGKFIQGQVSLLDFEHPDDAIYMLGGSHRVMSDDDFGGRVPDHLVYIPTVKHESFSPSVGRTVLWDRYTKRGDFG